MKKFVIPRMFPACEQIGACTLIDTDDASLLKYAKDNAVDCATAKFKADGQKRWIRLWLNAVESDRQGDDVESTIHFHVEVYRQEPEIVIDDKKLSITEITNHISRFIEKACDITGYASSRCRMKVPRADIPENGVIAQLLRFRHEACDAELSLDGASISIRDDFFEKMSFHYHEKQNAVSVELWSSCEIDINPGYLSKLSKLAMIGADCFVLQRISKGMSHETKT